MATDVKSEPEDLLPPDLRKRWIAIPRYRFWFAVAFFALLGAGLALWIVGLVQGIRWMMYSPPLVVVAFWILNLVLKRQDRQDQQEIQRFKQGHSN